MSHPAWAAIRAVDKGVFGLWKSKAQKIAHVLMASLIMKVRKLTMRWKEES